jgi:FlaA1/EpsC-like NDP-sugar epimerase
MTIPEAAQLVLQAGIMAEGGEVFVLDMGQPVRVYDLAKNMIELSGLSVRSPDNPEGDIEIEVIGLRPGEKLYEELLIGRDPTTTAHPRIMMASETFLAWPELELGLAKLREMLDKQDAAGVRALLTELVPEYQAGRLTDWVASARDNEEVVQLSARRGRRQAQAGLKEPRSTAIS